jgi:hypothetical protein
LYPNASVPVTYQFCVTDGQCSAAATGSFNVTGPTAQITPILSMADTPIYATGEWWMSTGYTGCSVNSSGLTQFMTFGQLNPPPRDLHPVGIAPGDRLRGSECQYC